MQTALKIGGVLCLLVGGTWLLQGLNVLPGSFMTGQRQWAINGALVIVAGVVLLGVSTRRRRP